MRTEKELLQVLLDNIGLLKYGLCGLARDLHISDKKILSFKEYMSIKQYIRENAPVRYLDDGEESVYHWPVGEIEPRRVWLEEEIKKLESYEK